MTSPTVDRERYWQDRWRAAGLSRGRRDPHRPKFFLVFAYPGTSGFLHIGHMRGYSAADVLARYRRMRGAAVFFPAGIHASGLPAVVFANRVTQGDPDTIETLHGLGLSEEDILRLRAPDEAARFLGRTYWDIWERFGLLLDPDSYVTTIDSDYQRFIQWQFGRLFQQGRLVQKPYYAPFCPRSGPVSVDPSETDLSRGGNAEVVKFTLLPFSLPDGRRLLAATLRPETVFGATNVWLPPSGPLQEWHHDGRIDLATPAGVEKLLEQFGGLKGPQVPVDPLLSQRATAPWSGDALPLRTSRIVDPERGTGIVMSVPAHAPVDLLAIGELPSPERDEFRGRAREVLRIEPKDLSPSERTALEGPGLPAERVLRHLGIADLEDPARLSEATEMLYRLEHDHGVMVEGPQAGRPVPVARDALVRDLQTREPAAELREFSEPVVCRCGERVVIRRVPDQWFLTYGSPEWKALARETARAMTFFPSDYGHEIEGILDWYEDRPAVRRGRWLGTPFPVDPSWTIEPIADSTFYPAYYVVRRYVARGQVPVESLTPAFFDYVFLGEGAGEPSVERALLEEIRQEFLYWYPLDVNLGGKEHKRVHFPVFIYTHATLLPPERRPRALVINWWTTSYSGGKISKKDVKGGAVPNVFRALERWGADGLRLYHAIAGSLFQDVEWDERTCEAAAHRLREVASQVRELWDRFGADRDRPLELPRAIDQWMSTRIHRLIDQALRAWENCDVREAAQVIYVELPLTLRRYQTRLGGQLSLGSAPLLGRLADAWTRLLCPITPHVAEDLGEGRYGGLVSDLELPLAPMFPDVPRSLEQEGLVERVEEDLAAVLRTWPEPPRELRLFVAADWKRRLERLVRQEDPRGRRDLSRILPKVRAEVWARPHLADIPKYLQTGKDEPAPLTEPEWSPEEELHVLEEARDFLQTRFSIPAVLIRSEEEGADLDPKGRRTRARPGRPAFYLVRAGEERDPVS
jgi:leucyl-tRNA synthetase